MGAKASRNNRASHLAGGEIQSVPPHCPSSTIATTYDDEDEVIPAGDAIEPPDLPDDVLLYILRFCKPIAFVTFLSCNKRTSSLLQPRSQWEKSIQNDESTWRAIYKRAKELGNLTRWREPDEPTGGTWKERFLLYYPMYALISESSFDAAMNAFRMNPRSPSLSRDRRETRGELFRVAVLNDRAPVHYEVKSRACARDVSRETTLNISAYPAITHVCVDASDGFKYSHRLSLLVNLDNDIAERKSDLTDPKNEFNHLLWDSACAIIIVFDPWESESSDKVRVLIKHISDRIAESNSFCQRFLTSGPFVCCVANSKTAPSDREEEFLSVQDAKRLCQHCGIAFIGDWSVASEDSPSDASYFCKGDEEFFSFQWSQFAVTYLEYVAANFRPPKR